MKLRMKMKKPNSVVWNSKFDMIFCLNYAKNVDRRLIAKERFEGVGLIPNDNFNWFFNFQSPYEHILFDVTKNLKLNECEDISTFNCMMGHYRIIRTALDIGCERILVLEDDNIFLKDVDYMMRVIDNTPYEYDIILYSYTLIDETIGIFNDSKKQKKINGYFYDYDKNFWGCGFYSLSKRAMVEIAKQYEKHARPADDFTTNVEYGEKLKKCCSEKCLSIQIDDESSMHKNLSDFYTKMGCNLKEYSI